MPSAAQLYALAERREAIADMHAENAARWSGEEAHHRKIGNTETAESFALMVRAAALNEARALEDAARARREARQIERREVQASALMLVVERAA